MKRQTNRKKTTVSFIQDARRAGLDMREVSDRLDKAIAEPGGLKEWKRWIRESIGSQKEFALGH